MRSHRYSSWAPSLALLAATACASPSTVGSADALPPTDARDATESADALAPVADAAPGAPCSFNRECPPSERCACDPALGCRCAPGPRGSGGLGAPCARGEDCASALCVEGPAGLVCSVECAGPGDCGGPLPRCLRVPTVGSLCARLPPDGGADASVSGDGGACVGCEGTALTGVFGARRATFDRAQHGRAGTDGLHVEAHFGGRPECPTMTSPTPDRTLVLSGVRATGDARAQTFADGVRATLLDFRGVLVSAPLLRATAVTVTPRAIDRGTRVALDLSATFDGGTITGTIVAPHCPSLDE
jgi:hypothetical protein